MNANEYQKLAARTLIDGPDWTIPNEDIMLVWNAIGLAGEAMDRILVDAEAANGSA